jgi:hypothetical protein
MKEAKAIPKLAPPPAAAAMAQNINKNGKMEEWELEGEGDG